MLDLDRDPVPGDPFEVKELARKLGDFADDVASALRSVRGLSGDTVVQEWAGLSGDAYRRQFGDLPGELDKLERSYRLASGALDDYWPKLETAQGDADRALAQGRTARQELDTAKSQLTNADAWVKRAQDKSKSYQEDPKPDVPPPSAEEVRAAARNATDAQSAHTTASTAVHSAQAKLDAAKQLAADAAQLRDDAASTAQHALHEASDAGIRNKHWWEKAVDWVADHWDDIIAVCKVIVAVLGIVVLIIGGPLAWLVLAAAVLVLADTVMKYLQGQASLWDVLFAALDCIPMFKGLTTAGGLLKMARELPALLKSGKALENIANSVRKGGAALRDMRETAVRMFRRFRCGDPIDIATGEMVMSAVDMQLPGVLPLVLERHHVSSYRAGRWFGTSWASGLDQRLVLDDQGAQYTSEDGMVLYYPIPNPDWDVFPAEGPRWPLRWDGVPGGEMRITRPGQGQILGFRALPGGPPAELALTSVADRNGNVIDVLHTAEGVPHEIRHSAGYRVGLTTQDRRITELRLLSDADRPVVLRYGYDERGDLTEIIDSSTLPFRLSYDDHHRVTGWEDRGGTRYRYEYDTEGRCVRTAGSENVLAYDYAYDTANRTTRVTDSLGHTTTYEFNELGQLVRTTDPLGNATVRTWDRRDNLLSRTDALGRSTGYAHDEAGRLTRFTRPDGAVTTVRYSPLGLPETVTLPDGAEWRHEYDERGNLIRTVDPLGAVTGRDYDTRGRLVRITDALGGVREMTPNGAGLPTATTDVDGAVTGYSYDAFGRIIGIVDALGAESTLNWTPEGKLRGRTRPDGTTEEWIHDADGNLVRHTDPQGTVTRFDVGSFDRLMTKTLADGTTLRFAYDTELRLTSVTNATGRQWTYDYDPRGVLRGETDFNGRTVRYVHDAAGQLVERINGAGEATCYVRDAAGRAVEWHDGDSATYMEYDPTDRLTRAVNADTELLLEHDALGRAVRQTVNGRTLTNTYDRLGRRTERRTPSGAVSTWEWDTGMRPTALRASGRHITFGYDVGGVETERVLDGGLVRIRQEWDSNRRLASLTVSRGGSSDGPGMPAARRTYAYGADDHVIRVTDAAGGRGFTLDAMGRVTAVSAESWTERYAYDALGNVVVGQWDTGRLGDSSPNDAAEASAVTGDRVYDGTLIRRAGRTSYAHDAQGRVIRRVRRTLSGTTTAWRFLWNAEDRLVEVRTPDGIRWRYLYDPLGRRTAKLGIGEDGTVVSRTDFVWDGMQLAEQIVSTGSGSGSGSGDGTVAVTTWDALPGSHQPVCQTERVLTADSPQSDIDARFYAIVTDLVGSPTELVDPDGDVVWRARGTLYGVRPPDAADGVQCPLRFPGQYFDAETGLHYNVFRYYDPEVGGYFSPDPLGLDPGPNHYAYVPNPLSWCDPLGLKCLEFFSVQGLDDAARLRGTGEPWPLEMHRAHFGPGVYSWGSRAEAEKYLALKLRRSENADLELMRFTIHEKDFAKLKKVDISQMTDDEAQAFLDRYSLMSDTGKTDHGLEYITRPTGMGPEHFFDKSVFGHLTFD
ncbi:RHS repeat-associated core domain-containing protein [Streptomyces sp. NPDC088197]|uniref:RHS repeat-associated core domain-containing protein n=1 Tax=Streptomyces sp. NPDC088197 TaxID=3365840 RepID=UPI0038275BBD